MIKLILFDLGGVVFTNGTRKFVRDVAARYNLPLEAVQEELDGEIGSRYREGKISRDNFWKTVIEKLNLKESSDNLESEWIGDYELIKSSEGIVKKLAKKYKVMYLSDNVRERVEKLNERFGFLSWFHNGVFSHEVGVRKPNPKIYEIALKKASVYPNESIFVDDKEKMLTPAKEMGITTILFESPRLLKKRLEKLGIL